VTDLQTAGRGRQGRTWDAPAGSSLLCSILLRPPAGGRTPELTLVAAIAVAQTVENAGAATQIKWPNDVLVDGRKLAGVLGELRESGVVLGIGINVHQTTRELPADARTPATSLRVVIGREHDRAALLGSLLGHREHAYDAWRADGLVVLREELGSRDFLRGRRIVVEGTRGVAAGIDDAGRLLIDVGNDTVAVESGEVVV
jgi:BirA family transcriptional regulator, biotin operon repressor / biotin---[acetyl-CoA-carboxylase] ligase